ncbi:hypothetical protein ACPUVO_06335 [Pseudocolwellia sp. HL-MZ19]|uniref:hypothetical protein n=1 Tax=unclassified Pseudocolwellia TaxID=2848178 RepID=UPI003CF6DEB7
MELLEPPMVDRRGESPQSSIWWDKLSLAQKFSASSLGKFGYELVCIRNIEGENVAILECNGGVATVSEEGEINAGAKINLRS